MVTRRQLISNRTICFGFFLTPADGLISGTMTGALLCSVWVTMDELVEVEDDEEDEGEEEGTPVDSRSPPFMARTEWLTLVSRLLGFGEEFSEEQKQCKVKSNKSHYAMCFHVIVLHKYTVKLVQSRDQSLSITLVWAEFSKENKI